MDGRIKSELEETFQVMDPDEGRKRKFQQKVASGKERGGEWNFAYVR